jgi:hypothetical protein
LKEVHFGDRPPTAKIGPSEGDYGFETLPEGSAWQTAKPDAFYPKINFFKFDPAQPAPSHEASTHQTHSQEAPTTYQQHGTDSVTHSTSSTTTEAPSERSRIHLFVAHVPPPQKAKHIVAGAKKWPKPFSN